MKVLIAGGGRLGYYLAATLLEHGHEPTIIEIKKSECERIANDLDIPVICGDGTSIEVLQSVKADEMDAFIGATGKDEDNLVSCQLAKKMFHIPKTVVAANNPKNVIVMKKLGCDNVICGTENIAKLMEREVDSTRIKQLLSINKGEATIAELMIPDNFKYDGRTLSDLAIPEQAIVVSVYRDNKTIIPRGNTQIRCGDKLIVMAMHDALHELVVKLKLG